MTEITLIAKVKAKKGMEETLNAELTSLVEPTRKESGCLTYILHQDTKDKSKFMFYENWFNKIALDKHLETEHLKAFLAKADDLLDGGLDVTMWDKVV